jgi:hypothetical protein
VSSKTVWLGGGRHPLAVVQTGCGRHRGNGQRAHGTAGIALGIEWLSPLQKGCMARWTGVANGCTWRKIVGCDGHRKSQRPLAVNGADGWVHMAWVVVNSRRGSGWQAWPVKERKRISEMKFNLFPCTQKEEINRNS